MYVQTPDESADRIDSSVQRTLVANIQLAQSMGAEVVKLSGTDVAQTLRAFARERRVSVVIVGESTHRGFLNRFRRSVVDDLIGAPRTFDVLVAASVDATRPDARLTSEYPESRERPNSQ